MWVLYVVNFPSPKPEDEVAQLVRRVEKQTQKTQELVGRVNKFLRAFADHTRKMGYPAPDISSSAAERRSP